jgi:hypothetical protein
MTSVARFFMQEQYLLQENFETFIERLLGLYDGPTLTDGTKSFVYGEQVLQGALQRCSALALAHRDRPVYKAVLKHFVMLYHSAGARHQLLEINGFIIVTIPETVFTFQIDQTVLAVAIAFLRDDVAVSDVLV